MYSLYCRVANCNNDRLLLSGLVSYEVVMSYIYLVLSRMKLSYDTDSKALKKIKLPFDQSKKIFKVSNMEKLQLAVDTAVDASKPELRSNWKTFLSHYVKAIEILTRSVDYVPGDIDTLEGHIDEAYRQLIAVAGIQGITNYFHYFGSGHILWLTRIHGNLWRFRNEGVEGLNGTLSLRYNKFNNKGGNKGSNKNKTEKPNRKCWAFEVLGSWMARLCMWQLRLGMPIFDDDSSLLDKPKREVKWRTGRRIKYRATPVDILSESEDDDSYNSAFTTDSE